MTELRLVVFDMDGTLIDSQDVIVQSVETAFAQMGRPAPSRAEILSIVGLSLPQALAQLAPDMDGADLDEAVARYKHSFVETRKVSGGTPSPLYAGAMEALNLLAAQDETLMGVATGKSRRGLDHVFAGHNLRHYFQTAQTADDHPSKPHPAMLHETLRDTGVESHQAVMVGDTTYDIEMGVAAGFRTVGVSWGYHSPEKLRNAGADIVIDDFAALHPALENFWG